MSARVFISYRRSDFGGHAGMIAGRVRDRLALHYGPRWTFKDTQSIPAAADFEVEVNRFIGFASVVIVLVGPEWCDEVLKRRGQVDHVLIELRLALKNGVPILPLLGERVSMPGPEVLTDDTRSFSRLNARTLGSDPTFEQSMQQLIEAIDSLADVTEFEAQGFSAKITEDASFGVRRFHGFGPGSVSFVRFFELMSSDGHFQRFLSQLLRESRLASYLFEMPPVRTASARSPVEFVLLQCPLMTAAPDRQTYKEYFELPDSRARTVVSFPNLGKDAMLVTPAPLADDSDYKDLRSFFDSAPVQQQNALWAELGSKVLQHLGERAIWVSVAGGGVPWLHFRIDDRPKYYKHAPYRSGGAWTV